MSGEAILRIPYLNGMNRASMSLARIYLANRKTASNFFFPKNLGQRAGVSISSEDIITYI